MRILLLSDFYPPDIGGTERHVQTLAHELVRRGHHVAVAALRQEVDGPAIEDDNGLTVYRLNGWNRALGRFYQDARRSYHPPLPDPGIRAALREVIEREQPQIIHTRRWITYSLIGLKRWSRAKIVMTLHDYSLFCPTMTNLHRGQPCSGPALGKCLNCARSFYGPAKAALLTTGLRVSSGLHSQVDR